MSGLRRLGEERHRVILGDGLALVLGDVGCRHARVGNKLNLLLINLFEKLILTNDMVHVHLGSILNKPPENAVQPDEKGQEGKSSLLQTHRVDVVRIGLRPDASKDGGGS